MHATQTCPLQHRYAAWLLLYESNVQAVMDHLEQAAGSPDEAVSTPLQRHSLQMASALRQWLHPAPQLVRAVLPQPSAYLSTCAAAILACHADVSHFMCSPLLASQDGSSRTKKCIMQAGEVRKPSSPASSCCLLQRPMAGIKRWWTQLGAAPPPEDSATSADWQTSLDSHRLRVLLSHLRSLLAPGMSLQL